MHLVHYSDSNNPITFQSVGQPHLDLRSVFSKPNGLWVSVADAKHNWKDWCESEGCAPDRLAHCYAVALNPVASICHLASVSEIIQFTRDFGRGSRNVIDWESVASHYDGIIISPYQWACRLNADTRWYYTWDCASGCFWNGVASIELCTNVPNSISTKSSLVHPSDFD